MIAEKQKNTNIGVGIGIVLEIIGRVVQAQGGSMVFVGIPIQLIGTGFFVWGCMSYSQGKGYSQWLGLLGLLSCIGLVILMFLPDKYKDGGPPMIGGSSNSGPGVWPPPPSASS